MECIDLNTLLASNSAENPSGEDLEYDPLFGELERVSRRREEQQFGDTVIAAEEPNWSELKTNALAVLARSKDLRAAVQLSRALIRTDGYPGLAAGLSLIRGYLQDYWDSLYPSLDPQEGNDPTIRINTLLNLCDTTEFLLPISRLPLIVSARLGSITLRDLQIAAGSLVASQSDSPGHSREVIDAAFREADPEKIRVTAASIATSIQSLQAINQAIADRLEVSQAGDLQPLLQLLRSAERELATRSSMSVSDSENMLRESSDSAPETVEARQAADSDIRSREDVLRSLDRICHYYAQREPSSPVPILLQRARRLVSMGFREIVRDLAPDGQSHFDYLWRQEDS